MGGVGAGAGAVAERLGGASIRSGAGLATPMGGGGCPKRAGAAGGGGRAGAPTSERVAPGGAAYAADQRPKMPQGSTVLSTLAGSPISPTEMWPEPTGISEARRLPATTGERRAV